MNGLRFLRRIAPDSYAGDGQATIMLSTAHQRPPIIKEYLDRPPIGDPAKNDQPVIEEAIEVPILETAGQELAKNHTAGENDMPISKDQRPM